MLSRSLAIALAVGFLGWCLTLEAGDTSAPPDALRIGIIDSLFRDMPAPLVKMLTHPLSQLIKDQTGMNGDIVMGGDAYKIGQQLQDGQLDLGVFHGIEFAWAQKKYPDLRVLVLAANSKGNMRANLVVNVESNAKSFADLRGKCIGLGWPTKEPCRVFMDRHCQNCGCEAKEYFCKITAPATVVAAMDAVCSGRLDATVVDSFALEAYKIYQPRWIPYFKVIQVSEPFPPGVIAYRHGGLPAPALDRCRGGLQSAHQTTRGKDLMDLWKITRFENPPGDFERTLTQAMQAYPPREPAALPTKATAEPQ